MNGRFGQTSAQQDAYLHYIALAYRMAPENGDEWGKSMLRKTLHTECERFGLNCAHVLATVHESVQPIDDELPAEVA